MDTSIAAAWGLRDEATAVTDALYQTAKRSHVVVPAIFPVELQNLLWSAERRGRITTSQTDAFWKSLSNLDIRVVSFDRFHGEPMLLQYSRAHSLTAYDASYLAVAHVSGLPLATADKELRAAARMLGIAVLPN